MKKKQLWHIIPASISCLVLAALFISSCSNNTTRVSYEFTAVRRGTVERTVLASGTINPVSTVRVLPQMSGKVEKVFVDFNDTVRRGDILAELNTDMLRLRREQQLAAVQKARANYELQLVNFRGQEALAQRNLISEFELRSASTTLNNLAADLAVAQATLRTIDTEINQYAFITSPIDGIVLNRAINEGDSVVDSSSNNAYSIFTLAENLTEMQIEANIGELDVASIYQGQRVRFSLESLPGRRFTGEVENLRLVPAIVNNAVTYTVIIKVENQDGTLLPGMTCAVEFIVERSENTLLISNAALRYQPTSLNAEEIEDMVFIADLERMDEEQRLAALETRSQTQPARNAQNQGTDTGISALLTGGGRNVRPTSIQGQARNTGGQERLRNLWYITEDGSFGIMRVITGIVSGSNTEIIVSDDLEGREFILRERL